MPGLCVPDAPGIEVARGQRFTNEDGFDKKILADLMVQKPTQFQIEITVRTRQCRVLTVIFVALFFEFGIR